MRVRAFGWVLLLAASSLFAGAAAPSHPGGQARPDLVQIADRTLLPDLEASGAARVIADYGSYVLAETDPAEAATLQASGRGEPRGDYRFVMLNAGWIDTSSEEARVSSDSVGSFSGKRLHLIHFVGPVQNDWYHALEATGVRVITYIPSNSYLVYGDMASLARLQRMARRSPFVSWQGAYGGTQKVAAVIPEREARGESMPSLYAVQLVKDAQANGDTLALLDSLKQGEFFSTYEILDYVNIITGLAPDRIAELAARPDVVSIQPYQIPERNDERQDMIVSGNLAGSVPSGPGYLDWLADKGFTQAQFAASAFAVDVTDSGVDDGNPASPNHFGLYELGLKPGTSRLIYSRLVGTPSIGGTIQGCDGHGTLNTHILAGYSDLAGFPHEDASGFHYGLGVCPFVRVGSSVIFDPRWTAPSFPALLSQAYHDGARISTNSWGSAVAGAYTIDSQAYDALVRDAQPAGSTYPAAGSQELPIVFSAGNSGPGARTIGAPGTAKNVITVGASENVQPFGQPDGCGISDAAADSARDMASFSSRGPCADGRIKPDLVAPGTHVTGGVFQVASPPAIGQADPCFTGSYLCGGPGASLFFPVGQQWSTASSGTSHAAPAVAGGAALLRQYFINHGQSPPSPAMTKAFLINSARYLSGAGAGDTLWSGGQGMGLLDLGTAFDGVPRIVKDERSADRFTASGQTRAVAGNIADGSKPFRVTLAWTDAPGPTSGAAYKNDLDLVVTVGGRSYKGNVFSGAASLTGGVADGKNNAESVFLPAGVSGGFAITVNGTNINSQADPAVAGNNQDYALVIYNGDEVVQPVLSAEAASVVAENCLPPNGALDPGEVVTVSLGLQNVGTRNTDDLVATLRATGGVLRPSAPQTYGVLVAGGASVARTFAFYVDPAVACGSEVLATLSLQDGGADLGTAVFNLKTGVLPTTLNETFDGVSAPSLPTGWSATRPAGIGALWATTATAPFSAPNDVYSAGPGTVNDNRLDTPAFTISGPSAEVSFRNNFALQSTFDGGVLELSIGGGPFQDILAAGGAFTAGGYNGVINSNFANPLAGRQAWTGNSGGYILTRALLPPSAVGQTVILRFRMGSDTAVSSTGWRIDDVVVLGGYVCCVRPPCPAIAVAPGSLPDGPAATAYSLALGASGGEAPYAYEVTGGSLPPGLALSPGGTLSGTPTVTGTWNFTVTATDVNVCQGSQAYSLTIICPLITLSPPVLPGGILGLPYSQRIAGLGGVGPYAFAVTAGSLPPGLALSPDGTLSGTPTNAGSWSLTIQATDANACTGSQAYVLGVNNLYFVDDAGRAKVCINAVTGNYTWNILLGPHAGESYAGTARVINGGAKVYSVPGEPNSLNCTYDAIRKRAGATFVSAAGVYSVLADYNTANNTGGCS